MDKKIMWLKTAYWTGAIADLIFGIKLMFFPKIVGFIWGLETPIQGTDLMWSKYFGLMVFSWTFILLFANKKPLERRIVILITAWPVVSGIIGVQIYALVQGLLNPNMMLYLLFSFQVFLVSLFTFSYYYSKTTTVTE
jgi:hypothetical protein